MTTKDLSQTIYLPHIITDFDATGFATRPPYIEDECFKLYDEEMHYMDNTFISVVVVEPGVYVREALIEKHGITHDMGSECV